MASAPNNTNSDVFGDQKKQKALSLFKKFAPWVGGGLGVILLVVLALAFLLPDRQVRLADIVIGDITITQEQIERNAEDFRHHLTLNPNIVLEQDVERQALEDLVLNASLKLYNSDTCHVEMTPQDIMRAFGRNLSESEADEQIDSMLGGPGYFLRVRMENIVLQDKMDTCIISQRDIIYIGAQVVTPYFMNQDEEGTLAAFDAVRQRLRDEFVPMLEQGLSASEIARHADIDFINDGVDNSEAWMLLEQEPAIVAGSVACLESEDGCLRDIPIDSLAANPGPTIRIWDKASELTEVGEFTDIFTSTAGMINIIRLESLSGGDYLSWEQFLDTMMNRYAYTRISVLLHSIGHTAYALVTDTASRVGLLSADVHASRQEHNLRRSPPGGGYTQAICDAHPLRLNFAARTASGLDLKGWSYAPQLSFGNCANASGTYSIGSDTYISIMHNCQGPKPGTGDFFPDTMISHPEGPYSNFPPALLHAAEPTATQAAIVHSIANAAVRTPGPLPWTPALNQQQNVSMIFIYPEVIDPVFQTRSAVTASCPGTNTQPSSPNVSGWNSSAQSSITIPNNVEGNVACSVGFHHDAQRIDDGTEPADIEWTVSATSSGSCSIIPATPASDTVTLVGGAEERTSTTTPVTVNIAAPSPGGTTSCTIRQTQTLNPTSFAEVTITRGADPPEIPGGDPGDPPTATPSAEVFSSHIRAQAIINGSVARQADVACHAGLAGQTTGSWLTGQLGCASTNTSAERAYARPGNTIAFGWTGQLVALHTRTTPSNRSNFPSFNITHTRCGATGESNLANNCVASNPPGTQLQLNTIHPGPSPDLRNAWTITNQNGQSGMEPTSPGQNVINSGTQNPRGSGHTVSNALLGRRDIQHTISVQDAVSKRFQNCSDGAGTNDFVGGPGVPGGSNIVCRQNQHQYNYTFRPRNNTPATATSPNSAATASCPIWTSGYCATPTLSNPSGWCSSCCQSTETRGCNYYGTQTPSNATICSSGNTSNTGTCTSSGTLSASYFENRYSWVKRSNPGPIQSTASFGIPYNYSLSGNLYLDAPAPIVLAGTPIEFNASVTIRPEVNGDVGGSAYATQTRPDSAWRIVSWYVNYNVPSFPFNNAPEQNNRWGSSANDHCQAVWGSYTPGNIFGCSLAAPGSEGTGPFNVSNSNTAVSQNNVPVVSFFPGVTPPLSDHPIGTKFCVAMSIRRFNVGNRSAGSGSLYGDQGWNDTNVDMAWHSTPTCVAIGEKPSTQVWAANFFSAGPVRAGIQVRNNPVSAWGSWVEYAALGQGGQGTISALGSGAAFAGGNPSIVTPAGSGFGVITNACRFSMQTLANTNCTVGTMAALGSANVGSSLAENISIRYSNRDMADLPEGWQGFSMSGDINLSSVVGATAASTIYIRGGNMNITTNSGWVIPQGRTIILDSTGIVTFRSDVVYHNGPHTSIHQIPQLLTFAHNINIIDTVSRVDSWLLAGLNRGPGMVPPSNSGTINTCSEHNGTPMNISMLSGDVCTGQLRLNGPHIANQVRLYRSHFDNSATNYPPSEIFNLRSDTYLWAAAQSQNYSQAFMTFSREVAPRF